MKKNSKNTFTRVNEQIRISPIMVIQDGANLGAIPTRKALVMAKQQGLDLVEVAPDSRPPVCRIMDYGKFKYEKGKKQKSSIAPQMKEIRLSPRIGDHDVDTKIKAMRKFLAANHKVQLKLRFKKRENAHKDLGFTVIKRIIEEVSDIGQPQRPPVLAGNQITCVVEPL